MSDHELRTPHDPATSMLPAVRYADSQDWRTTTTGPYRYTDPVTDTSWPRIADPVDDDLPDRFPPGWGDGPTERDQAAIDAGNA